ncbi:hypothetical protein FF2_039372 [Malus domestica]
MEAKSKASVAVATGVMVECCKLQTMEPIGKQKQKAVETVEQSSTLFFSFFEMILHGHRVNFENFQSWFDQQKM